MGKTLTKADIVDKIHEYSERNRAEIKAQVEHLIDLMKKAIKNDHALLISGFGKFEAYEKNLARAEIHRPTKASLCRDAR